MPWVDWKVEKRLTKWMADIGASGYMGRLVICEVSIACIIYLGFSMSLMPL